MKKLFKKFWYLGVVMLAVVAFTMSAVTAFGASGDALSNELSTEMDVYTPGTQITLTWGATPPASVVVGASFDLTVHAVSNDGDIPAVLDITYDATVFSVTPVDPTVTVTSAGVDQVYTVTAIGPGINKVITVQAKEP